MSTWLNQLSPNNWSPERYRLDIWEGERVNWEVGGRSGEGQLPKPGDIVVFFYAKSNGTDPGFYGWGIVNEWYEPQQLIYFRPTAPSDYLKMHPWWDDTAKQLSDKIRGKMKHRTLWLVPEEFVPEIRHGISEWLACKSQDK